MAVLDINKNVTNIIACDENELETSTLHAYTDENPAFIGGDYFEGYFYPPKPYPSWLRDGTGSWVSPAPYPNSEEEYTWNEEDQTWVLVLSDI